MDKPITKTVDSTKVDGMKSTGSDSPAVGDGAKGPNPDVSKIQTNTSGSSNNIEEKTSKSKVERADVPEKSAEVASPTKTIAKDPVQVAIPNSNVSKKINAPKNKNNTGTMGDDSRWKAKRIGSKAFRANGPRSLSLKLDVSVPSNRIINELRTTLATESIRGKVPNGLPIVVAGSSDSYTNVTVPKVASSLVPAIQYYSLCKLDDGRKNKDASATMSAAMFRAPTVRSNTTSLAIVDVRYNILGQSCLDANQV